MQLVGPYMKVPTKSVCGKLSPFGGTMRKTDSASCSDTESDVVFRHWTGCPVVATALSGSVLIRPERERP